MEWKKQKSSTRGSAIRRLDLPQLGLEEAPSLVSLCLYIFKGPLGLSYGYTFVDRNTARQFKKEGFASEEEAISSAQEKAAEVFQELAEKAQEISKELTKLTKKEQVG